MINIVFITRSLNYGGATTQLVNLVKGLDREKFNPTVLTFYSGPLEKDLREANARIIPMEKKGRWHMFGFLIKLYRLVKEQNPDVIHGYLTFPNILTVMLKPFFPKARTVYGVRASNMDLSRYDWLARLIDSVESRLSRFTDLIIANSKAGFKYALKQGFPEAKMIVIPNGIDTEHFKPDYIAGQKIRNEWGVREDEFLIGLVGKLDPMKDHPTFIKAAALFSKEKQRENVRFVCVGGGRDSYRDKLIAMGKELGLSNRILWINPRSDMPAVFNAFDIATSSSSFGEGFPNVVGEAMACKIPCVVTDVGDSPWVVGKTGIVVPPENPEALAAGWAECMAKDKDEAAQEARFRIENNFSLRHLFQRTEQALTMNGKTPNNDPLLETID
ncbi:MAG: glycosyl transferase [Nitrospinaceae bacterium]|nr:MAG: glycosyl transferase [Nitrospinaceae bacterium]